MSKSTLTKEEEEAIQKQGAHAYAVNKFNARNPYLLPENMPSRTGEPHDLWVAKRIAWEFGYQTEKSKS